jgi:hypothetical protein
MAYPIGAVQISGTIGTTSVLDTYATHQDYLGFGGLRAVADTTERDAITSQRRTFGMIVTLQDGGGSYILANIAMGGTDNVLTNNANWIVYAPGGSTTYTNTNPTTIAVGGYALGSTFTAQTMADMWDGLLYPYIPPTFTSFAISAFATSYEVGAAIGGSKTFTWSFSLPANVTASSMDILDVTGGTTLASGISIVSPATGITIASYTPILPATYSWRGRATNTQSNLFVSSFFTASWFWKSYYGTNSSGTLTAGDILALISQPLSTTVLGTYSFAALDYKYFCWPDAFGSPPASTGTTGFLLSGSPCSMVSVGFDPAYNLVQNGYYYYLISVTNTNGVATNYRVYRTLNTLGAAVVINVA